MSVNGRHGREMKGGVHINAQQEVYYLGKCVCRENELDELTDIRTESNPPASFSSSAEDFQSTMGYEDW